MSQSDSISQESTDTPIEVVHGHEFIRIMKYFSNKALFVFAIIFSILLGAVPFIFYLIMGDMITIITETTNFLEEFHKVMIKIIVFIIFQNAVLATCTQLRSVSVPFFIRDLRRQLLNSYLASDIEYFDEVSTGIMVSRISQDVTLVTGIYVGKLSAALQMIAQTIGGVTVTVVSVWQAGLIMIGSLVISGFIYFYGDRIVNKIWAEYSANQTDAASKAEEIITSFRTVKSFDCELKESQIYKEKMKNVDTILKRHSIAQGTKEGLILLVLYITMAIIFYYVSWMIQMKPNCRYESGDLFIILMSLSFVTTGISTFLTLSDDFKMASASAAKLLEIFERKSKIENKNGSVIPNVKGKIEFRDVTFHYNSQNTNAVEHLNFVINPGETIAFVGESGCGKTTVLQLIERFYDIDSGCILLDDVDITKLSPNFIRSQIAMVQQTPVLFSMSISDNIKYADINRSESDVVEAAQIGNAHDFIMDIPNAYNAEVKNHSLSGGQKQRICISRAILANTPILLLDEATASLDTESERLIQESLNNFRKGKTAIVVAHRLATVMNADRILVLHNGRIVEEGLHEDLIKNNGIYSELVKYQLQ